MNRDGLNIRTKSFGQYIVTKNFFGIFLIVRENEAKMGEAAQERMQLTKRIEENKQIEAEQDARHAAKHMAHQNDLLDQMDYNQRLRNIEMKEEERLWRGQQDAEREYRTKLEEVLASDHQDKMHPMRMHALGRRTQSASQSGLMY